MSFDVTALENYTKENVETLIVKSFFDAKTQQLITANGHLMTGVKTAERLPLFDTDAIFQDGSGCGWNASGTTVVSAKVITVAAIKIQEALCPKELNRTYLQLTLKAGVQQEAIPFEQTYTETKASKTAQQMEVLIWQGDTDSMSANLDKIDGVIKIVDVAKEAIHANAFHGTGTITSLTTSTAIVGVGTAFTTEVGVGDVLVASGVVIGTVATVTDATHIVLKANGLAAVAGVAYMVAPFAALEALGLTAPILKSAGVTRTNVIAIINAMWLTLPAELQGKDDVAILVGWDVYQSYIAALIVLNLFAYTADNSAQQDGEILVPGTKYKIIALHGLDATKRLYACRLSNLYLANDMEGEENKFDLWYTKDFDEVRYTNQFRIGVQVGYVSEVVEFELAA